MTLFIGDTVWTSGLSNLLDRAISANPIISLPIGKYQILDGSGNSQVLSAEPHINLIINQVKIENTVPFDDGSSGYMECRVELVDEETRYKYSCMFLENDDLFVMDYEPPSEKETKA